MKRKQADFSRWNSRDPFRVVQEAHRPVKDVLRDIADRKADRKAAQQARNGWLIKGATVLTAAGVGFGAAHAVAGPSERPAPAVGSPAKPAESDSTGTYIVQPGDNLWEIGTAINHSVPPAQRRDIREVVDGLAQQHGGAGLNPGDHLQVPAAADADPKKPGVQLNS